MRTASLRRSLRFCSLVALTLCLCLLQPSLHLFQNLSAQANDIPQLAQQGVEAYQSHRYTDAINYWETALTALPEGSADRDRATIHTNLARAHQQLGQPKQALTHWQAATATYTALQDWTNVGRTLTEQAQTYSRLGQPFQAIGLLCGNEAAQAATNLARSTVPDLPKCGSESAVELTQRSPDSALIIAAWGSLGEAFRSIQIYDWALQALQTGLALAETPETLPTQALLHNSLGNTYREQAELNYQQAATSRRSASGDATTFEARAKVAQQNALDELQTSLDLAQTLNNTTLQTKALLGLIGVYSHTEEQATINDLRQQALSLTTQLPPDQEAAYLMLQLAKQRTPLATPDGQSLTTSTYESSRSLCKDISPDANTLSLLQQANDLAKTLGNNRLQAFAKGEIGHYYECSGDYSAALAWTQQARLAASSNRIPALDTLYLWQWQTGRIYKNLEQLEDAIAFYTQAAQNLNELRDEILASNQTLQFDFRDAVAPVYRELAEIQLSLVPEADTETALLQSASFKATKHAPPLAQTSVAQANIRGALGNIDNLQLAELQNYFGSDCIVPVAENRLDELLSQGSQSNEQTATVSTALISTIIFPKSTAVILTLPNQVPKLHRIEISEPEFREKIIKFRDSLEDAKSARLNYDTSLFAQDLYQDIIAPFEDDLEVNNIQTILFVHDGILRNIPMAALHDGEQYLIEKYAVAIAPSLQIPQVNATEELSPKALVLGLSETSKVNNSRFTALPAVKTETENIARLLSGSKVLLDGELTEEEVRQTVRTNAYSVFHIATHGQFGTDPQNTFLVMGEQDNEDEDQDGITDENRLLRLGELDTLIREGFPRDGLLELIALSACQTASGDERSSLGLAGITIRAGAKSALASLWSVEDEATANLMTGFYRNWTEGQPKAEALRKAQIEIMKSDQNKDHPYYWSAFILAGDWQ